MKEIKPYIVVLFIAGVILLLSPFVFLNKNGKFDMGLFQLSFATSEDIFHPKKQIKKDISGIVALADTSGLESPSIESLELVTEPLILNKSKNINTSTFKSENKATAKKVNFNKSSNETSSHLTLNELARQKLYAFFEKIVVLNEQRKKVHVLHYGDSQIEGDRMTAYIRQRIQNQFGGNGPGMIPAMNVYVTQSFKQSYSSNFHRYTCFGGEKLASKKYGVMGAVARFVNNADSTNNEAWIEVEPSNKAQSRSRYYNQVKLFYTDCNSRCKVKVFHNSELILEDSLISDGQYHILPLQFTSKVGKLKFVFSGKESPVFCGFSLEGDYGVQVDNIGMRGCSGTFFNSLEKSTFKGMLNDLKAELIILQFGGNSVPYFKDSVGVRRYAKVFQSQIKTIKQMYPSAAIIVIGPSDMSLLASGIYETYPYLPYCVSEMRKAVLKEGAGYWDLFKAMGGKNSMPSWVESGLAGRDYIHFTNKGASIASQLFYDALEKEYAEWKSVQ